jgi:hypothetical protein
MISMGMADGVAALTHGWPGLALAYVGSHAPLMAGLRQGRATLGKWLLSPVAAMPAMLIAGAGMASAGAGVARLAIGVGLSAAVGYLTGRVYARSGTYPPIHQRGAQVQDAPSALRRRVQSRLRDHGLARSRGFGATRRLGHPPVTLAGVPLAAQDETKHVKVIGTTGTGKSTAIREILSAALARGDSAIIADPDGGYLARFYDPSRGDVIMNPFDERSVKWNLFGEIHTPYDVEQLARSLIPDAGGPDRSWVGYARTFFTAVTRQANEAGVRDLGELYRLLVIAPPAQLRTLVAGTPAQPFLEEQNGRMFDSIRSVTSSAVGALEHIARQQAEGLSIRDWVRRGAASVAEGGARPRPVLFMPYRAGQIAALRSTISAWMRIGIFEAMDQPEHDQRLWFVVDELDALGQIDGLKDALARLRKFGGRCVLGFQSIAQVSGTYGQGDAQTIVENTGNTLILRTASSEHGGTSQFASRLIGQREVMRTTVSRSRRPLELLSSTTRSQHVSIEPAVLDDLEGYLKRASDPRWLRVRLAPHHELRPVHAGPQRAVGLAAEGASLAWRRFRGASAAPTLAGADPAGSRETQREAAPAGRDFEL